MSNKIAISRDKKNPTWAWVWNGKKPDKLTDYDKRIIVDACGNGCICVTRNDEKLYVDNGIYDTITYTYYEIIKEPTYRPIKTLEDYIEATKDRNDLRVIAKDETFTVDLRYGDFDRVNNKMYFRGYDGEYIFDNCVWLDDRSPVGVKCL